MVRITRRQAVGIYSALCNIAIGHLDDECLDAVMDNISALGKVHCDLLHLNEELNRRLYEGIDEKRKESCFTLIREAEDMRSRLKGARNGEDAGRIITEIDSFLADVRSRFPDVWDMYEKHTRAYERLLEKEVEIEIALMDEERFTKGIVKGRKDIPVSEVHRVFAPLFAERKVAETDLSELDDIINP